jgi:hypothetical protein
MFANLCRIAMFLIKNTLPIDAGLARCPLQLSTAVLENI